MAHNTTTMSSKASLVFFCKSHLREINRVAIMVESFHRHNKDKIKLFISVPEIEIAAFLKFNSKNCTVISDESYAKSYLSNKKYWGLSEGYINQEICKLSFWETELCKNYLCVDSDLYFIKNFRRSDFLHSGEIPYSVLVMDKDLQIEKFYSNFGNWRMSLIKKIFRYIKFKDERYLTCHGMQVLNAKVLGDFRERYVNKHNLSYEKLIKISPYEFTWYNAWLQKSKIIPIYNVEPFFKTFHSSLEYIYWRLKLITERDISAHYFGIVMNSNWSVKGYQYNNPNIVSKILNYIVILFNK